MLTTSRVTIYIPTAKLTRIDILDYFTWINTAVTSYSRVLTTMEDVLPQPTITPTIPDTIVAEDLTIIITITSTWLNQESDKNFLEDGFKLNLKENALLPHLEPDMVCYTPAHAATLNNYGKFIPHLTNMPSTTKHIDPISTNIITTWD
jgi:hypothetical protein